MPAAIATAWTFREPPPLAVSRRLLADIGSSGVEHDLDKPASSTRLMGLCALILTHSGNPRHGRVCADLAPVAAAHHDRSTARATARSGRSQITRERGFITVATSTTALTADVLSRRDARLRSACHHRVEVGRAIDGTASGLCAVVELSRYLMPSRC